MCKSFRKTVVSAHVLARMSALSLSVQIDRENVIRRDVVISSG